MKNYTIFTSTHIKSKLVATEETLLLNLAPGDLYVEGHFSDEAYYVKDGVLCAYPEKPNYPCLFDRATETWVWNDAASWAILRHDRDRKLAACDWVTNRAVERGESVPAGWAAYRQALRDLPANAQDPRNVVWPTPPS